jgi:tRNA dimethylallyltransferase
VELASRFNGEIINGDAMQMYDGLPIITNKITLEEQNSIPHHLLGFVALDEEPWRVGLFQKRASQIIREIRSRGRLPILVGGTHYYTQSLLIQDSLVAKPAIEEEQESVELSNQEISKKFPILDGPTETMIERLKEVDPVMADRWHPNDRRKIRRSLEIFLRTGKRASDVYMEQRLRKDSPKGPGNSPEGYEITDPAAEKISPLIFWVHSEAETLKARLDARVDKMMEAGLLAEVKSMDSFLRHHTKLGKAVDSTRGIWISIGWKEFEQYLSALRADTESQEKLDQLLALSIEKTKTATRQYAKRQTRWIRLKLIPALSNQNLLDKLYVLDGTHVERWSEDVSDPAIDVTTNFLAGNKLRAPGSLCGVANVLLTPERSFDYADRRDLWVRHECEICQTVCTTEELWQRHLRGRPHRRRVKQRKNAVIGGYSTTDNDNAPSPEEAPGLQFSPTL